MMHGLINGKCSLCWNSVVAVTGKCGGCGHVYTAVARAYHNEICGDDDLIFCDCGREHTNAEIAGECLECGGAVCGILMAEGNA